MRIQLQDICFSYRPKRGAPQRIFDRINLDVPSGQCIGIIGEEGSGKSTLLQIIDGLIRPDRGSVLIDGKDLWSNVQVLHDLRPHVGFMFQFSEHQFFAETVRDELLFGVRNFGLSAGHHTQPDDVLRLMGLNPQKYLDRSPFSLSLGEARKIALASLIISQPQVLLLDEPTVGLDGAGSSGILDRLQMLHRNGATVVVVSHDLDFLAEIATRIIVLRDGIAEDSAAHVLLPDVEKLAIYGYRPPEVVELARDLRLQGLSVSSDIIRLSELKEVVAPVGTQIKN